MEYMISRSVQKYVALVGIDWADRKHVGRLLDLLTGEVKTVELAQKPEAIQAWVNKLRTKYQTGTIAIALEQSRGPLMYALIRYDLFDLYPVNPMTMASFRKAWATSGAKDDPTDADLLLQLLAQHSDKLRCWKANDPITHKLTLLCEKRRKIVDLRTRLSNGLKAVLKEYFPQALEIMGDNLTGAMGCDFLLKWPTFQELQRARENTVQAFFYQHNSRSAQLMRKRLDLIRDGVTLTDDSAVLEASAMMAMALVKQLRQLVHSIRQFDAKIEELYKQHEDYFIFDSLPGSGPCLGPRILTVFGIDRERWEDASDIQKFTGIAPVMERSGKTVVVHKRYACPKFARQTFHEFAGRSKSFSVWAKAYYDQQRDRGNGHHAAVRSLAFKWQRIIFRCWKKRVPYDEAKYLQALQRSGSELLDYITGKRQPTWAKKAA